MCCERVIWVHERGDNFNYVSVRVGISHLCWCCNSRHYFLSFVPNEATLVASVPAHKRTSVDSSDLGCNRAQWQVVTDRGATCWEMWATWDLHTEPRSAHLSPCTVRTHTWPRSCRSLYTSVIHPMRPALTSCHSLVLYSFRCLETQTLTE